VDVDFVVVHTQIFTDTKGDIQASVAVNYIYQLEGVTREDILRKKGDALARLVKDHATGGVKSVGYEAPAAEMWENPRTPLRGSKHVAFYYCGNCGTPLRPGACDGCGAEIIDVPAARNNPAPTLPKFVCDQITRKNLPHDGPKPMWNKPRYNFSIKPKTTG
jgi:hypothetical protein